MSVPLLNVVACLRDDVSEPLLLPCVCFGLFFSYRKFQFKSRVRSERLCRSTVRLFRVQFYVNGYSVLIGIKSP